MPVGKQLGTYSGDFSSVRTCAVNGDNVVVEGSYTAKVSNALDGTAVGTMTFSGTNDRGAMTDLGVGYLSSGDVVPYKATGVYWKSSQGNWETRAAVTMGDQMLVVEGSVSMSKDGFSLKGAVSELT